MHQYDDKEQLHYEPLQFVHKSFDPLIANIKLIKRKGDSSVNNKLFKYFC